MYFNRNCVRNVLFKGAGGFTPDFVQVAMAPHIKDIKNKGKTKI